ncbi:hypothetical protein FA95DRAFT_1610664 [Auriscalpium vulgare]|uniref:Uncharacterized protein n=1 Tax=Auriscalpium vulgare TaxID=40419 RepID=A0ACB8RE58_9AGAM|nr:hypothetical protein FA95DRAFT_1610664 [Auriscalpium vulgare]
MSTLPLDIQVIIIELVYRSSQHLAVDYPTLLASALVCRAWRDIAQRLLFRRIPFPDGNYQWKPVSTIELLLRTLRTSPHLAVHVRAIHLTLWCRRSIAEDTANIDLLELCPHVTGIFFAESLFVKAWDPHMEARLRAIPLRPLSLKVWDERWLVSRILEMWPSPRALEVLLRDIFNSDHVGLVPVPSSIEALSLPAADAPKMLLPVNGLPALRHLDLLRPVWAIAGSLRTLAPFTRLKTLSIQEPFPPQEILDELGQVESIVCDELPVEVVVLPRTLRHTGCHLFNNCMETSFLELALRTADGLQLSTCTFVELLKTMEAGCRDRGVDLALYESWDSFPSAHHVDWI